MAMSTDLDADGDDSPSRRGNITELDRRSGMRLVLVDGLTSQAMETLASGLFLTAFAVALGASNLTIGVLASIPALAQLMQIPGVVLVERVRRRRTVTVAAALAGRSSLVAMGAAPWLPQEYVLPLLMTVAAIHALCGSIAGCSWNSWMRDLLPPDQLNRFFARRMMYSTLLGAVLSFATAHLLATAEIASPGKTVALFSALTAIGGLAGLAGIGFVWRTPEPPMVKPSGEVSMMALLAEPFHTGNFRRLMIFLAAWGLAVNLATPFFTVYMLRSLDIPLSSVTLLVVCGQLSNVASIQLWGRLADRFSNKTVLRLAGHLLAACLVGWVFTGNPGSHAATLPLLYALHFLMGIATAGVTLAAGSIALKLSPPGRATAYLAANSVVTAMAAGIAPIAGGLLADTFATRQLGITIHWTSPGVDMLIPALQMRHWQFFFVFAAVLAVYALGRLRLVQESGEVRSRMVARIMMDALKSGTPVPKRPIASEAAPVPAPPAAVISPMA